MVTCAVQFCKYKEGQWVGEGKTYYYNFPNDFAIKGDIYDVKTNITYSSPVVITHVFKEKFQSVFEGRPVASGGTQPIKDVEDIIKAYPRPKMPTTGMTFNDYVFPMSNKEMGNTSVKKEENKNMFGMNFEFGKVPSGKFKMSVMGLAYNLGDGRYGVYNMGENEFTDVTELTLDMDGMIYQMPIATKDVAVGDIIKHKDKYVIVKEANASGSITVIEPINRTELNIIPTKSVFGFSFVTKVTNLFGNLMPESADNQPSEDNPFGNIMPFMMMSALADNKSDNNDVMKMFMLSQMMNSSNGFDSSKNPFMAMMLMKNM